MNRMEDTDFISQYASPYMQCYEAMIPKIKLVLAPEFVTQYDLGDLILNACINKNYAPLVYKLISISTSLNEEIVFIIQLFYTYEKIRFTFEDGKVVITNYDYTPEA